jgi:Zn finger protein HypA/HybF involved in hydrogenase expression
MSSFHQKKLSTDNDQLQTIKDKIYVCPNCGKKTMQRVSGQCVLDDGVVIENLQRLYCTNCRSDFFDLPAMKRIRKIRNHREAEILEHV